MSEAIIVSKSGIDAGTATDPNSFIFHSTYNTFKIISTGTANYTLSAGSLDVVQSIAHNQSYTPLAFCMIKWSDGNVTPSCGKNSSSAALVYNTNVYLDGTNINLNFRNHGTVNENLTTLYYICEMPTST